MLAALLPLTHHDGAAAYESSAEVERLRCELHSNPLAIEEPNPQLSWVLASEDRGVSQSAYQVLVASTREALHERRGDLWDSGRVESDNTIAVPYEGAPLSTGQLCHWSVRVWDQAGKPSEWSQPATWRMGLLQPGDWEAEWIGYDSARSRTEAVAPFDDAKWVLHGEDQPGVAPEGHRAYIARFVLPEGFEVDKAEVMAVADNRWWMAINTKMVVHDEPGWEIAKPVVVTEVLQPGENEIRFNVKNDAVGPSGLLVKLTARSVDGEVFKLVSDESWLTTGSCSENWPWEAYADEVLVPCRVVGDHGVEPWGKAQIRSLFLPPVSLLRGEFQVSKPVESAVLHATALGICDAHLNGQRVSDEYFTPGWTDYAKRVYYRSYDVTDRIQLGANALGGVLADGWYSGYIGWGQNRDHYGTTPRLKLQLHVYYADGTSEVFATSPDWKATTGATVEADFLMGETHDATLEQPGWDSAGFEAEGWESVVTGSNDSPVIEAPPGPPVVAVEEFVPVSITEPRPGVHVFDMGQNFAGVVRLKVSGEPGQKIRLRFAERLKPDGTLYTTNLRGARTIDTYTCRGGDETWQPRYTFHGFQYVEVTGLNSSPTEETVTGVALSSNTPRAGWFECSHPMLNRLHKNVLWTQYANFIDVPTDCPQRDERLGWTGDAQVYVATACLNADVQGFFRKWLVDLEDSQREDGQFPMVAPLKVAGNDGGPAWADAGVICPWTVYDVYADERLLERLYPSMKRFVDFCKARSKDGVLPPDEFHCFGDWLSIKADTPHDVIYTAYYAHCSRLLAKSAEVLGNAQDAAAYAELYERIKAAFNEAFVQKDGVIKGETQCVYVLALANDLLDGERRTRAAEHLIADIESRGFHLSTGFVGTKDLMLVLAKIGRNDIAYRLINNQTFPSWGFSIQHGATSIWERWDGWTPENGFQNPGMNSFAHYSFGAVYQWMVENIGGIRRASPGYRDIVIAPQRGGGLSSASTRYDSVSGPIATSWKSEPGRFSLNVSIPPNTTAEVRLPSADASKVSESGQALSEANGVTGVQQAGAVTTVLVGSGDYEFSVDLPD